jgi:exodeoxyribonuclease VII small subunit
MVDLPPDIAALSFEEALAELEGIVKRLETGATRLDDAIAAYERGAKLRAHCEARLKEAQARVERIVLGPDGVVSLAPTAVE